MIFSCAKAEEYPSAEVFGLVITARCDIAHNKAHVYNYIPIVPIGDWLRVDGARLIVEEAKKNCHEALKKMCGNIGLSYTLVQTEGHEGFRKIVETHYSKKIMQKQLTSIKENCSKLSKLENLSALSEVAREELNELASGIVKSVIKRLLAHNIQDYHFINTVEARGKDPGYVMLFREIRMIPHAIMQSIISGINFREMTEKYGKSTSESYLHYTEKWETALPVGIMSSPAIEHILQRLALLFSRIGVEDIEEQYVELMVNKYTS